jgi:thioester reductase-like protein
MVAARVTLVTGFPSFRAAYLVRHLLEQSSDWVWAVVPPSRATFAERFVGALDPAERERVRLFFGEPSAIDMGLSGAEYGELSRAVSCIQHVEQTASDSRETCELVNIGGMREALELASAARQLETLVVHSSVSVSGDRTGRVEELDLEAGQGFPAPSSETLARAERMARKRMPRLPIVVLRSGQVVGPAGSGHVDTLEGVYLLILLVLSSPQDLSSFLPRWGDAPLHVVPVDHWVLAATLASRTPAAIGRTLHVTDPAPMTFRTACNRCISIRARLGEEGFVMPPIAKVLRRDGLVREGLQSLSWRPRTFINMTFRHVEYATDVALELLGIECPRLESYFENLVRHVARSIAD